MKRYDGVVLDDDNKPVHGVEITVRKAVGGTFVTGGDGGDSDSTGAAIGGATDLAEDGASGGGWGVAGGNTSATGGSGGNAVKLTGGATVTWTGGNTADRVKGAVG